MFIHRTMVEIIKMSSKNIGYYDISANEILLKCIRLLYEKYLSVQDKNLLMQALQFIYAYIELGFPVEEYREEFQQLTYELEIPFLNAFPEKIWKCNRIRLTKTQISDLLGRWNPRLHSMKAAEAVKDIYDKVLFNTEGVFLYHSGRLLAQDEDDALWEKTFRLFIQSGEAILYDVNKNRYYIFERGKNK